MRGEVGLRAVLEVPDVVQRHVFPVDGRVGEDGHVRLPVALVRRRDPEPPRQEHGEGDQKPEQRAPSARQRREAEHGATGERERERMPEARGGQVRIVDRKRRPRRHDGDNERDEHRAEEALR